jgi:hypothetical protein
VSIGDVFDQALGLYRRFFWRFAATTAVVLGVLDLVSALALTADRGEDAGAALWALVSLVLGLVGTFWVQGALTLAVEDVRDGRVDTTIGELYARTRPFLGALILAGILAAIGIGIGLVLLIAPGLYLLARWALIVPAIVIERRATGEAFTRSSELTAGHRWSVLAVALLTLLVSGLVSGIIQGILTSILPDFLGILVGSLVAQCVTTPFLALSWTVMYFELRRSKEPPAETSYGDA